MSIGFRSGRSADGARRERERGLVESDAVDRRLLGRSDHSDVVVGPVAVTPADTIREALREVPIPRKRALAALTELEQQLAERPTLDEAMQNVNYWKDKAVAAEADYHRLQEELSRQQGIVTELEQQLAAKTEEANHWRMDYNAEAAIATKHLDRAVAAEAQQSTGGDSRPTKQDSRNNSGPGQNALRLTFTPSSVLRSTWRLTTIGYATRSARSSRTPSGRASLPPQAR